MSHLKPNVMKRVLLSTVMSFLISIIVYAQQEVTTFLGIPVDGSKSEMMQKLKDKGFKPFPDEPDILTGEFNGGDVLLAVGTNNNKVWRIGVVDTYHTSATDIRIRFNKLCRQFQNNKKYMAMSYSGYEIPEEEDIAYEITVNDKRYEAAYYQLPTMLNDSVALRKAIQPILLRKFTEEQLANPTEEIENEIERTLSEYLVDNYTHRIVWFMISSSYGEYYITMFYDNKYNQANGEDL